MKRLLVVPNYAMLNLFCAILDSERWDVCLTDAPPPPVNRYANVIILVPANRDTGPVVATYQPYTRSVIQIPTFHIERAN